MKKLIIIIMMIALLSVTIFVILLKRIDYDKSFISPKSNISSLEIIDIDYGDKYHKQFLDELTYTTISTHFGLEWNKDNIESTVEVLNNLGIKSIRDDIRWGIVQKKDGTFDFSSTDMWINELTKNKIEIQAVLGFAKDYQLGNDYKISSKDEVKKFLEYAKAVMERYPQIKQYEIWNEPNGTYITDEQIQWYSYTLSETKKMAKTINDDIEVIGGATMTPDSDSINHITSENFIEKVIRCNKENINISYSFHLYDWDRSYKLNTRFKNIITRHTQLFNDLGGFSNYNITETGIPSTNYHEKQQAEMLIQQKVIWNSFNDLDNNIYNLRNMGEDITNTEHNFGLINYDYTPKQSYFVMKNYYENTNGSEYIGKVNIKGGLEAHVYDKDGKPKIIVWSNTNNAKITIPYTNYSASDMYGSDIENVDNKLEIDNAPVYLDNVSDSYFYEAISNTALEKYSEFEEKFKAELDKIDGLTDEIDSLKEYIKTLNGKDSEDEKIAIEKMNKHFNLGNVLIDAVKDGSLDIEYMKLSSMLDMLNDIGLSYEDLLTVCATTREPYYTETNKLINSAESKINNNSDLEIIYPAKILDFAKELDEKSEYINSLEEENDIKTGLIVSNSLHAYYLAKWADEFASIYIDEYINTNPVTLSYSNEDWTNTDVTATLNIDSDSKITNNGGKNTYTFSANGNFTFEYERRGQEYKVTAKVSKIDKVKPTIEGVENGKIYYSSITPIIKDVNLDSVKIKRDNKTLNYYEGITLAEEGLYSIEAKDKAGNTKEIAFYITEKSNTEYIVQDSYILNIDVKTTVSDFIIKYGNDIKYITRDGLNLAENDVVATGDIIELQSGEKYTAVVAGDINGDGKVSAFDLSMLRKYILKQQEFNEIEKMAADINLDGNNIGAKDYSRMRLKILGIK